MHHSTNLAPTADSQRDSTRWWALILLCLAQFMVILDVTVVNVALPTIGQDLGLDRGALTWVVTAYTLCFGGLMMLGGRLADAIGRRSVFLTGLILFTAASLVAGLGGSASVLIGARAVQGVGAALLSPAALSIVATMFNGAERRRALGIWAAIGATGAAVGVLVGGALVSGPGWEWVFFVNVPVGLGIAAALPALVGAGRPERGRGRIDIVGALTVTAATALLIRGLLEAGDAGWSASSTLLPLAGGLVLAAAFVGVERVVRTPLVQLRTLAHRPLAAGAYVMLSASGLLLASFFLTSIYLQRVQQYSALETGLTFLPMALGTLVGAHLGAQAIGRVGARPVAGLGFALAMVGLLLLARLNGDADVLVDVLPGFTLTGAALGATFVTATITAMSYVRHDAAGTASGVINTSHELGGSLGVALVSTIAAASLTGAAGAIDGFTDAFLACGLAAGLISIVAALVLPAGRPSGTDRPAFAH